MKEDIFEKKIEYVDMDIDSLNPAVYNPREIDEESFKALKKSIERFKLVEPIVINQNKTIIGGHQRVRACKELGYIVVTCVKVDLDQFEEKLLNITLNSKAAQGIDVIQKLQPILKELRADPDFMEFRLDKLETGALSDMNVDLNDTSTKSGEEGKAPKEKQLKGFFRVYVEVETEDEQDAAMEALTRNGFQPKTIEV